MCFTIVILLMCGSLIDANDNGLIYDKYTGVPASNELLDYYASKGIIGTCTIDIAPCDPNEWRRVDGSCNSLDHPSRGTFQVPPARVLPAHYFNGSYSRKSVTGCELELPRVIRTTLLSEGKASSKEFSKLIPGFGVWFFSDVGSIHDITFFLANKTDCCHPDHMNDYMCTPNIYPEDDPVHRFSGIRCTNLTRPLDHQFLGCTNDTTPAPLSKTTAVIDLSQLYNAGDNGDKVIRSFEGGRLATETDEYGIVWPAKGVITDKSKCMGNRHKDGETRCFSNSPSGLMSTMMLSIWFLRNHNFYAKQLAEINPCWDDDMLFYTAREINMAVYQQIAFYEWLVSIIGRDKLIDEGVISDHFGFRDVYDCSKYPLVTLEYLYTLRWFHTMQEGTANEYYPNGTCTGNSFPETQMMFRPGFLGKEENIVKFTPGMFRQPTSDIDHCVDPTVAEIGMPTHLQRSVDITTSDLHKARTLGLAPYIDYVHYCTGHTIKGWKDLTQHMTMERIELMKTVYPHERDIDVMAGMWGENIVEGGKLPATVACLIVDYLGKAIRSDRHWYERDCRPHAFTADQLNEIRKSTLAAVICNNADGVSQIQKHVFHIISPENPLVDCSEIPNIDINAWADSMCSTENTCSWK